MCGSLQCATWKRLGSECMPEMSKTRINTFRIFSISTTKVKAFSIIMQSEEDEVGKENRCQPLFVSAFCCAENRLRACWSESESSCSPQPYDSNNGVARCKSAHISCIALSHEAANSLSTGLRARRLLVLHSKGPGEWRFAPCGRR